MSGREQEGAVLAGVTRIVSAYVSNNPIQSAGIPGLIIETAATLNGLGQNIAATAPRPKPAVPIKNSVQDDYIVCLEDGARLKMLKRYLRCRFGLCPDDYRRRWGLPPEYPMVAPAYAARRSELAKASGLGKVTGRNGR